MASLDEAIGASNEFAPEHLQLHVADPGGAGAARHERGRRLPRRADLVGARRLRRRHEPRAADRRARARRRRARAGGVPEADPVRPRDARRSRLGRARSSARSRASRACRSTRPPWRRGCDPRRRPASGRLRALRVDAVVPAGDPPLRPERAAAPGRAAGADRRELRAPERVPGRELPRAARGGGRVRRRPPRSRSWSARARTT